MRAVSKHSRARNRKEQKTKIKKDNKKLQANVKQEPDETKKQC
jgi:hypothetical protein